MFFLISVAGRLEELLIFFTGAKSIPRLGYEVNPTLQFRHRCDVPLADPTAELPLANTCGFVLTIPVLDNFIAFKNNFDNAMSYEFFDNA